MSYYTRVLTQNPNPVTVEKLIAAAKSAGFDVKIEADTQLGDWTELTVFSMNSQAIVAIERNLVSEGTLGEGELDEFKDELAQVQPQSSAEWLRDFFEEVRCIYAFQHLQGANSDEGFAVLQAIRNAIWGAGESIIQADGEGFSNADGYHITWQFSDTVKGKWWMGLLVDDQWTHFEMDLGNKKHRDSFKNGKVPPGAKLA